MEGKSSEGIKGWLLVYLICSIFVIIIFSIGFSGFFFDYPFFIILINFLLLAIPPLLILLKSPKAPKWNIVELWVIAVLMILRAIVFFVESGMDSMILGLLVFSLVWAIIWTNYFKKSLRVRNTFIKIHQIQTK